MSKQKSYSADFKFKVALEMIRSDLTVAEIIAKYQFPRSVISRWKRQLLESGAEVFKSNACTNTSRNEYSPEIEKLHATIWRLKVENDFLQAASLKLKL